VISGGSIGCGGIVFASILRGPPVFLAALLAFTCQAAAQQRDEGERAFQKCYSCHSVDARETGLSGPNLAGVIGRRAASRTDFAYSPAMKKAEAGGLVWSEEALDRYMADPLEMIPETTMSFPGVRDPAERRAIIAYLRRFPPRP
jgi:cytochrome c2